MSRKFRNTLLFVVLAALISSESLPAQQVLRRLRIIAGTAPSSQTDTLNLYSTFDNIGYMYEVVGDTNDNATAVVEYKTSASGTWITASDSRNKPYYDNRPTLYSTGSPPANPYVDEMRGSVVGLAANTSYDVRLTVTDPDSGITVASGTISTLGDPTFGGTIRYVDDVGSNGDGSSGSPFNTLSACQTAASAGDTCFVRNGTYPAFSFTKSGTTNAWIKWEGESEAGVTIQGGSGVASAVDITADFLQIKNFTAQAAQHDTIRVNGSSNNVWLDNFTVSDVSTTEAYGDAAVKLVGGASHIYLFNCVLNAPSTAYATPRSEGPLGGVEANGGVSNIVVKGCTIDGRFRDGIAQTPENLDAGFLSNSDFLNNTLLNIGDDNIQAEGNSNNVRIGNNRITGGTSCLATQESYIGPVYYYRNMCNLNDTGTGPTGWKGFNGAGAFFFHNTMEISIGGSDLMAQGTNHGLYQVANNVLVSNNAGNILYASLGTFDYNVYYRSNSSQIISDSFGTTNDYTSLVTFFMDTGQEEHGINGNPSLQGTLKTILNTSNAYNSGVTLLNFNDANSAWPAVNGAPDRGYYEVP